MITCEIPKNILKHKTKFIGSFTLRESVCGVLGVIAGLLGYFKLFHGFQDDLRIGCCVACILPFFLVGFVKIYDEPFEKMAVVVVLENFIFPPKRTYETKFVREKTPEEIAEAAKQKGKPAQKKKKKITLRGSDILRKFLRRGQEA